LGRRAGARTTLLFHHDPRHDDDLLDRIADEVEGPGVSLAVEGSVIDI
jgi:phosphoribosyl 1,2-cyclic phosphodiesterase